MLRRLHHTQPESFAFTPENRKWADAQIAKYPEGRQASAVIPLLWRAQEQEGWVSRPIIEAVAEMLDMADIRVLEVASFYFMFQMKPVGSVAHFQICGTTSCMICGAEDLIAVAKDRIAPTPHTLSPDGKFSWEEVECLGACSNAPMAQIGKDYYEDLTVETFGEIIDDFAAGKTPTPGSRNGRFASEPLAGLTSLKFPDEEAVAENASKELARILGDTNARITDGRGISRPYAPETAKTAAEARPEPAETAPEPAEPAPEPVEAKLGGSAGGPAHWSTSAPLESGKTSDARGQTSIKPTAALAEEDTLRDGVGAWRYGSAASKGAGSEAPEAPAGETTSGFAETAPKTLSAPIGGNADDLKLIKGVGPKLETTLNELGFWHFDQIAAWSEAEVAWVDSRLKFKGRIQRDGWIDQARVLGTGGSAEFADHAANGDAPTDK